MVIALRRVALFGVFAVAACSPNVYIVDGSSATDGSGGSSATDGSAGNSATGGKSYDMTAEFPGTANPNGPWTYGWAATMGGTLTLYPKLVANWAGLSWGDPANNVFNTPLAWKNTTSGVVDGVPPGMASLHPGQSGEYSVARFTAPSDGTYSASIQFFSGDSGETDATVYVNGAVVFSGATSTNPHHTVPPTSLSAGVTIEIWVGPFGSGVADNTPVKLTIQAQ
jgi:hypothetical protein